MARSSVSPAQESAAEAWRRMRAIVDNPETVAREHVTMHETGLTGGPLRALRTLPLDEAISMRQLAARMGCDGSYVTGVIDTLQERGLVVREPHPTDRRVKVIAFTPEGRRIARRVQREDAMPPSAFAALDAAELASLCALLRALDG